MATINKNGTMCSGYTSERVSCLVNFKGNLDEKHYTENLEIFISFLGHYYTMYHMNL